MKHKIKTLADIAEVLSGLTPEQLQQPANISVGNSIKIPITKFWEEDEDYLINKLNPDEYGYEADLKLKYGAGFDRNCYDIFRAKGQCIFIMPSY